MGDISTLLSAKEAMVRLPMDLMLEVANREAEVSLDDNMLGEYLLNRQSYPTLGDERWCRRKTIVTRNEVERALAFCFGEWIPFVYTTLNQNSREEATGRCCNSTKTYMQQ